MAAVTIDGRNLVVEMPGWEKVWALKGRLEVPLRQVRGIKVDSAYAERPKGIRFPGTYIPKVITAGTYLHQGEKIFWDVRDPQQSVVIDLSGGKYSKLVLQVEHPDQVVSEVRAAIGK
ncbi:hypothetical protein JK358_00050 [Nocardia sp. 2]|uniref:Bacterial Pleckstrin homology domain-containing protein n=1 Tax=Nocardia acididurans TaxID=2802282 RepID=A0ABS1LX85_9NOCA|nr:hypothetical protein [Nocardia acididurans]MBL1072779.1 hypothetical protein [Nocardia acididurans]